MIEGRTTGQILQSLRDRSGLSVRAFAKAAGYKFGSGVQRYIDAEFDGPLDVAVAGKLGDALSGRGEPPITRAEVMVLTGISGVFEAEPAAVLPPRYMDLPRDVRVYGTAIGTFAEDERIEQTVVEMSDPIDMLLRPPGVANREGVYGLYITGESQSPRFNPGDVVFVDPKRPPAIGDDVIVYLKAPEGDGEKIGAILIKQLTRRGHSRIELHQYNPAADFSVDIRKVGAIHRVLTTTDLWAGYR